MIKNTDFSLEILILTDLLNEDVIDINLYQAALAKINKLKNEAA